MTTERVVLIRHKDAPTDDRVTTWLETRGIGVEHRYPFRGDRPGPADGSVLGTVIYGGPFNVFETDRHPFLLDEARWIEDCMARGLPVLGICQGAQQIAYLLGARCGPLEGEPYEFGYYPVHATEAGRALFPDTLMVAQSHFHGFELPAGAERLARGDTFPNQAFRHGECTFGFQFHAEVTRTGFSRWQVEHRSHYGNPGSQTIEEQNALGAAHDAAQACWFDGFLETLFASRVTARVEVEEASR